MLIPKFIQLVTNTNLFLFEVVQRCQHRQLCASQENSNGASAEGVEGLWGPLSISAKRSPQFIVMVDTHSSML